MMSIEMLRSELKRYGAMISAPRSMLKVLTGPQATGGPYVNEHNGVYVYRVAEKGVVFEERRTHDPDEVLFWLMQGIVFQMACQYELNNRVGGTDPRYVIFQREIELFSKMKPEWAERQRRKIKEVLRQHPFTD